MFAIVRLIGKQIHSDNSQGQTWNIPQNDKNKSMQLFNYFSTPWLIQAGIKKHEIFHKKH